MAKGNQRELNFDGKDIASEREPIIEEQVACAKDANHTCPIHCAHRTAYGDGVTCTRNALTELDAKHPLMEG